MIGAAALEMHMLRDAVRLGVGGEQQRCIRLWAAGAGALAASTPTLTVGAAMSLLEQADSGLDGGGASARGLGLLAAAGLGPVERASQS
jgi:hypothetical protein